MSTRRQRDTEAGITLLEILVVLTIIGLISTVVAINVLPALQQGRAEKARTDISQLTTSLEYYNSQIFSYPTEAQGLEALIEAPSDLDNPRRYPNGGFIQSLPDDPWGRPYQYIFPAERSRAAYDLFSFGADGVEGGEGDNADIGNWDEEDEDF